MIPMTFTCHVCGEERPDAMIGVRTRKVTLKNGVAYQENVRYCLDKPACVEQSKDVRWTNPDEEA